MKSVLEKTTRGNKHLNKTLTIVQRLKEQYWIKFFSNHTKYVINDCILCCKIGPPTIHTMMLLFRLYYMALPFCQAFRSAMYF